jgi:hypothetical protein
MTIIEFSNQNLHLKVFESMMVIKTKDVRYTEDRNLFGG